MIRIVLLALVLTGCSGKLNGKYLRDVEGNIYHVEHRFADMYFLHNVDMERVDKMNKAFESLKANNQ